MSPSQSERVPKHSYDRDYLPIPDAPNSSMLAVGKLPDDVQRALGVLRDFELQGAAWPSLMTTSARAWFRYYERAEGRTSWSRDAR